MAKLRYTRFPERVRATEALLKANPRDGVVIRHVAAGGNVSDLADLYTVVPQFRPIAVWRALAYLDDELALRAVMGSRLPSITSFTFRFFKKHDPLGLRSLPANSQRWTEILALYLGLADYARCAMPKPPTKLARTFYRRGRKLDWVRKYYGPRTWQPVAEAITRTYYARLTRKR